MGRTGEGAKRCCHGATVQIQANVELRSMQSHLSEREYEAMFHPVQSQRDLKTPALTSIEEDKRIYPANLVSRPGLNELTGLLRHAREY